MDAFSKILAGKGGHVIVDDGDGAVTDYHFWGFVPQTDTTLTSLQKHGSSTNVAQTAKTYTAGIFYPCDKGYYDQINIAAGDVVLYTTLTSPHHSA